MTGRERVVENSASKNGTHAQISARARRNGCCYCFGSTQRICFWLVSAGVSEEGRKTYDGRRGAAARALQGVRVHNQKRKHTRKRACVYLNMEADRRPPARRVSCGGKTSDLGLLGRYKYCEGRVSTNTASAGLVPQDAAERYPCMRLLTRRSSLVYNNSAIDIFHFKSIYTS